MVLIFPCLSPSPLSLSPSISTLVLPEEYRAASCRTGELNLPSLKPNRFLHGCQETQKPRNQVPSSSLLQFFSLLFLNLQHFSYI
jgi:hypothetical protein